MFEVIKGLEFGVKLLYLFIPMMVLGGFQLGLKKIGSKRKIRFTKPIAVILSFVVVYLSTSNGADFPTAVVEGFMFLCTAISIFEFCSSPSNFPSEDD